MAKVQGLGKYVLSSVSLSNLQIADYIELDVRAGGVLVSINVFGHVSYVHQRSGDLIGFGGVDEALAWARGVQVWRKPVGWVYLPVRCIGLEARSA